MIASIQKKDRNNLLIASCPGSSRFSACKIEKLGGASALGTRLIHPPDRTSVRIFAEFNSC